VPFLVGKDIPTFSMRRKRWLRSSGALVLLMVRILSKAQGLGRPGVQE